MATGKRIVASDGTVTEPNGFVYVQRPGNGEKPAIAGFAKSAFGHGGAFATHGFIDPERKLVTVNCSAVVDTLFESELFGHMRGAFTGATDTKVGLFEHAHAGTIFLDEIGELPPAMQAIVARQMADSAPLVTIPHSAPVSFASCAPTASIISSIWT